MTFSVLLTDGASLAVATASCVPAAGGVVAHLRPHVGVAVSQARGEAAIGREVLARIGEGQQARAAVEATVRAVGDADRRQVGGLALQGTGHVHTGSDCHRVAAHEQGADFLLCGNLLAGEDVVPAMRRALEKRRTEGGLLDAALAALWAGERAGGDVRGRMSAALRAHGTTLASGGTPLDLDLRVDLSLDPLADLERAVRVEVDYQTVSAYVAGHLPITSLEHARTVATGLADRPTGASAAVLFCRAVVADRLGEVEEGRALASELAAWRPGPAATRETIERLWDPG